MIVVGAGILIFQEREQFIFMTLQSLMVLFDFMISSDLFFKGLSVTLRRLNNPSTLIKVDNLLDNGDNKFNININMAEKRNMKGKN
jgi:hypothetical protein